MNPEARQKSQVKINVHVSQNEARVTSMKAVKTDKLIQKNYKSKSQAVQIGRTKAGKLEWMNCGWKSTGIYPVLQD